MLSFCISFNIKLGHMEFLSDRKKGSSFGLYCILMRRFRGTLRWSERMRTKQKQPNMVHIQRPFKIPTLCHTKRMLDDLPVPLITEFNSQSQSLLSDPHTVILFCKQDLNMTGTPRGFLQELKGERHVKYRQQGQISASFWRPTTIKKHKSYTLKIWGHADRVQKRAKVWILK